MPFKYIVKQRWLTLVATGDKYKDERPSRRRHRFSRPRGIGPRGRKKQQLVLPSLAGDRRIGPTHLETPTLSGSGLYVPRELATRENPLTPWS